MSRVVLTFILAFPLFVISQVANDDCSNALPLGTLPNPANCGNGPNNNGQGAPISFTNLTNVGSTTENPYTTLTNCQGSGQNMASPATDVWYSFVPTGLSLDITINGLINEPNVALWTGSCGSLIGAGCDIGSGGSLTTTIDQLNPGQTYYLQISGGDPSDEGTFDLTLQNNVDCDACLLASTMTVDPLPMNGTYQPGTVVTFCFTVSEWNMTNTNWFHGVVPIMGSSWTNLTPISSPATCDSGPGIWDWFTGVSTPLGNADGFFFDGAIAGSNTIPDGDPNNNFGDACEGTGLSWEFCWQATVEDCPPGQTGDDLSVNVETYGDGETGNWSDLGCNFDPVFLFSASLACCASPLITATDVSCQGLSDGDATAEAQTTASPWDFEWQDDSGNIISTTNNSNSEFNSISNLTEGTYTVTVTDANGCVSSATITVSGPAPITPLFDPISDICNGDSFTLSNTSNNGVNGSWSPALDNTVTTTYTFTPDPGQCASATDLTVVVIPNLADPIVSIGAATCTSDGTATIDNYDGTLTYTFSPAGPTVGAGGVISGMTPGTSYDVVADDGSCSSGAVTFSVEPQLTVPADPIVSTGAATCTADGTATIDNYDGTLTYTFTPAGPTANVGGIISGTTPGISYDVVADDGVCTSNASNSFTIDAQLPTPTVTLTPNDPSACNGTDGSILVSGVGSGTVTWSGAASGTDNSANLNYTIQNLGAGTYDVFFVDGTTGCQSSTESTLLNNPGAPIVDPINSVNNCGTDYTLGSITGSDLVNPQYYDAPGGPAGGGNIVSVGTTYTAPTNITLYAYDQNGICISEQIFTVLIEELPTVTSVNGGNTYCIGDTPADITADVTGNGPWTIDYTIDGLAQIASGATSPINLGNAPGIYVVTNIMDATCDNTATGTQSIDFYTMPTVSAVNGGADYCPGDVISDITVDVTGNGPWTIDFTLDGIAQSASGATSPINLGNSPGEYVITNITDANCTDIASGTQTINVNPIPTITLTPSDPTVCNGNDGSVLVSGIGSGTVTWSGSASGTNNAATLNYNIANLGAGSYDVLFIDGTTGCQSVIESTILNNPSAPVAPIISTNVATCTADGSATIDNYDVTLTYTFTPAGPMVGAGGAISGMIFGTSYTLQADDGNCLSAESSSFSIDGQLLIPTIILTPIDPSVCNGTDGSILVSGVGSGNVVWNGTASGNDNTAVLNYTITDLGAGSYDIFFIDGITGCQSAMESTQLNNPGAPSLNDLSSTTACDTYILPAITGTNLSGNQSYYTQSNGAGTPLSEGDVVSSTQTIYIYDILGTCADESNFTITIDYTPSLTNPGPQQGCEFFNLSLGIDGTNLSGNENYYSDLQSNGGTVITDAITSSQTVYIYDANGNCSNEISFEVTVNPLPSLISFTGEGTYCEGDDVNNLIVEVSGAPDYTLDYTLNGNPTTISSSNSSINLGNTSGVYILTALNDNNCGVSLDATQTITINSIPDMPYLTGDSTYCENAIPIDMEASGSSGFYTWYEDNSLELEIGNTSNLSPYIVLGSTSYYVTATENGCEGLPAEITIIFETCEIIIPTAFTPDDDMVNDTWELGNIDEIYPNNVVSIYNRWGNKLFESMQGAYNTNPWNGTYRDKALPVGSYYYIIEFNDNYTQNTNGIVSILKN